MIWERSDVGVRTCTVADSAGAGQSLPHVAAKPPPHVAAAPAAAPPDEHSEGMEFATGTTTAASSAA